MFSVFRETIRSPSQASSTWERLHLSLWQLAKKLEKSGRWMLSCKANRKSSVSWKREGYWDSSCHTQSRNSRKTGAYRGRKKRAEVNFRCFTAKTIPQNARSTSGPSHRAPHLLLVIVTVIVDAAVEAVAGHHPLLLHQALEAMLGPAVGVTHDLHQAGHHTAHVPVVRFCKVKTGAAVCLLVIWGLGVFLLLL